MRRLKAGNEVFTNSLEGQEEQVLHSYHLQADLLRSLFFLPPKGIQRRENVDFKSTLAAIHCYHIPSQCHQSALPIRHCNVLSVSLHLSVSIHTHIFSINSQSVRQVVNPSHKCLSLVNSISQAQLQRYLGIVVYSLTAPEHVVPKDLSGCLPPHSSILHIRKLNLREIKEHVCKVNLDQLES